MTDLTNPSSTEQTAKPPQRSSRATAGRTVSAVLFVGGLAVCAGALYQPPEQAPTVRLAAVIGTSRTSGTSGTSGSSGTSGTSGT
ncbi:MAG: hypothetical protein QOC63_5863, partial [Mycobacterium sp.]|nr:hypothetical protein [Mycobacterium sp.]